MSYPDFAHDEFIVELYGTAVGPNDVGEYDYVTDWIGAAITVRALDRGAA